jgi:DNA polymerase-3 subunit epsilon
MNIYGNQAIKKGDWGMGEKPGNYNGSHYTLYVDNVKKLKKEGNLKDAETLLYHLVSATEAESKANGWAVASWYYEMLAKIYREQKNYLAEIDILKRFFNQRQSSGGSPKELLERLNKAKELLKKNS